MRVAQVVISTADAGVERHVRLLASGLTGRGHEVVLITNTPGPHQAALEETGVAVVGTSGVASSASAIVRRARAADIVHTHMTRAEGAAVLARPWSRAPVVTTRHFPSRRGSSIIGRLAAPFIRRSLQCEIAVSDFVARGVAEPTILVRNAVADAPPAAAEQPVVLVVQRLEPEKHTALALDIWRSSGLAALDWELHIAGDGAQRADLERRVADERVVGVRFLGHRDDVPELLRGAGIVLATAPSEPFGLSAAEAMAVGLPVVAARGGGHVETVGAARPDLLFAPGDAGAGAALLRDLVRRGPDHRRRVGGELRHSQQRRLGMERQLDETLAVYARVCD